MSKLILDIILPISKTSDIFGGYVYIPNNSRYVPNSAAKSASLKKGFVSTA